MFTFRVRLTLGRKQPVRSGSMGAGLLGTRILGAVAAVVLVAGITSDLVAGAFWQRHAMLAGLCSSGVVVMLTVGVFNEWVERHKQQHWSVLAQYVLLDLVRDARMIWTGLLEWGNLMASDSVPALLAQVGDPIVGDRSRLAPAFSNALADTSQRQKLHDMIAALFLHSNEMLGRWAGVMLNVDFYAAIIDRHVELASDIMWLSSILDSSLPPSDPKRHRLARVSPAVQIEGQITDAVLVDRLIVIAQLAEELDHATLQLALRLVPIDWWQTRLGAGAPSDLRVP